MRALRHAGSSCGWIRQTDSSRLPRGGRSWAEEIPSPGPWREAVGRRAHPATGDEEIAMRPKIRTEPIGSQGQVVIQTDAQAPIDGMLAGRRRAADRAATGCTCGTEHCASVFARIRAWPRIRGPGIAPASLPVPDVGALLVNRLVERGVDQRSAATDRLRIRYISSARRRAGVLSRHSSRKALKQQLQETEFQSVNALVLHQFGIAQSGDFLLHRRRLEQCRGSRRKPKSGMASISR